MKGGHTEDYFECALFCAGLATSLFFLNAFFLHRDLSTWWFGLWFACFLADITVHHVEQGIEYLAPIADKITFEKCLNVITVLEMFRLACLAAPRLLIQLYWALSFQQEPLMFYLVTICLHVSLIHLTWFFTEEDMIQLFKFHKVTTVRQKVLLFFTHFSRLGSRVFIICYFVMAYKWWSLAVVIFHSIVASFLELMCCFRETGCMVQPVAIMWLLIFFFCYWITDTSAAALYVVDHRRDHTKRNQQRTCLKVLWLSNALFAIENTAMSLMLCFNTWYWLLVTVCVFLQSVFVGVVRYRVHSFDDNATPKVKIFRVPEVSFSVTYECGGDPVIIPHTNVYAEEPPALLAQYLPDIKL